MAPITNLQTIIIAKTHGIDHQCISSKYIVIVLFFFPCIFFMVDSCFSLKMAYIFEQYRFDTKRKYFELFSFLYFTVLITQKPIITNNEIVPLLQFNWFGISRFRWNDISYFGLCSWKLQVRNQKVIKYNVYFSFIRYLKIIMYSNW